MDRVLAMSAGPASSAASPQQAMDTVLAGIDNTPSPLISDSNALISSVPKKIREEIWTGEYFDLSKLMKHNDNKYTVEIGKDNSHSVSVSQNSTKRYNIHQWREAFLKYSSCYSLKFKDQAQDLLSYIHTIDSLYQNFQGFAWRKYDEEFRQRKPQSNLSWTQIDSQLYMTATAESLAQHGQSNFRGQTNNRQTSYNNRESNNATAKAHQREVPDGYCRRFAIDQCSKREDTCKYTHKCFKCKGHHASLNCRAQKDFGRIKSVVTKPNKSS
jgi:hypothetical protein